jgi:hypothetical protein
MNGGVEVSKLRWAAHPRRSHPAADCLLAQLNLLDRVGRGEQSGRDERCHFPTLPARRACMHIVRSLELSCTRRTNPTLILSRARTLMQRADG